MSLLMISRLCGFWLFVLVVSAFTTPCASCDVVHPIRLSARVMTRAPLSCPQIDVATFETGAAVLPSRVIARRLKLMARAGHGEYREPSSSIGAVRMTEPIDSIPQHVVLATVLRL